METGGCARVNYRRVRQDEARGALCYVAVRRGCGGIGRVVPKRGGRRNSSGDPSCWVVEYACFTSLLVSSVSVGIDITSFRHASLRISLPSPTERGWGKGNISGVIQYSGFSDARFFLHSRWSRMMLASASPTPFRHHLLPITLPQLCRGNPPSPFFPAFFTPIPPHTGMKAEISSRPPPFRSISVYAAHRMHAPFLGPALLSPPWHMRRLLRGREGGHVYAMRRGCCERGGRGVF